MLGYLTTLGITLVRVRVYVRTLLPSNWLIIKGLAQPVAVRDSREIGILRL